ncbi:hypothetical protein C6497_01175 [Candidatus Poribacteria bacterium]|nr:MAG: hypothetical protein C6497_01175 [Candidatus Poribacteria bacterium]
MLMFDQVLQNVEKQCRDERIPMLGPEKAEFVADCIEKAKPSLIVECGTAVGYSGLWILRVLREVGSGQLITIEIDSKRAEQAQSNFEQAGVADLVDSRIGDAEEVLKSIDAEVDFLILDNNFDNYYPCFKAIEPKLTNPATVLADNVGIGADTMADYLEHVRTQYESETHWFDIDLPWVKQDAIEVSVYRH